MASPVGKAAGSPVAISPGSRAVRAAASPVSRAARAAASQAGKEEAAASRAAGARSAEETARTTNEGGEGEEDDP
ncbi:MAG: hypothetical protein ACREK2_10900 [Gemmatimonadota bacterium]